MAVTQTNITYASSIDPALTTLKALVAYTTGATNLAICVVMHGWSQIVDDLTDNHMIARFAEGSYYDLSGASGVFDVGEAITGSLGGAATCNIASSVLLVPRSVTTPFQVGEVVTGAASGETATVAAIATNSLFCIYPEMRGRNGGSGTGDGGGREIQDIIDAIDYVLANYASETDASQIYIVGYSGGGGNTQSATARFPDRFNAAATFFGMCDYGYASTGWWHTNTSYQASIEAWLGGTPSDVPAAYRARASILARRNYSGGHLFIFHDYDDSAVNVINATRQIAALDALGYTNYTASLTDSGDAVRWLHESPEAGQNVILAERQFLPAFSAKTYDAWSVPDSGILVAGGWIDTSELTMWLDDGLDTFGTLTYNMAALTYTLSVSSSTPVVLVLHGQTPSANVTATINGNEYTETADGNGDVVYSLTIAPTMAAAGSAVSMRRPHVGVSNPIWIP